MRSLRLGCVLLLIELVPGCSRCDRGAPKVARPASIHRFLPRVAEVVLVIPKLDQLGAKLRQLERLKLASFAAQLQGFPSAQAFVGSALEQLGVDLRSPDELARAGIDAGRGAAMAIVSARRRYAVIAVTDALRFRQTVRALAESRLGAGVERTHEELGRTVVSFARPGEAAPVLAMVTMEGFALIAAEDAVEELPGYAALAAPESLAESRPLSDGLSRLPASADFYVHLPTTSNVAAGALANGTLAVELTPKALQLRIHLPRARGSPWLAMLTPKPATDLSGVLPADAFLVARFAGDPQALARSWPAIAGRLGAFAERSDFPVERELGNLESGIEAAVSLAPTATFSEMPSLDLRRTNLFRYFHLVTVAPVKNLQIADEMLDKLPALAQRLGATMKRTERQGRTIFLGSYSLGQALHFARLDGKLIAASPVERMDQTLAELSKSVGRGAGPIAEPELRKALTARPLTMLLDLPALAQSIRRMPSSAWGIGGFAIKATTLRWLDSLDELRAVTAAAYAAEEAVEIEMDLRFVDR